MMTYHIIPRDGRFWVAERIPSGHQRWVADFATQAEAQAWLGDAFHGLWLKESQVVAQYE
jgi:hypothetical protein